MSESMLLAAFEWVLQGVAVIPLCRRSKIAAIQWTKYQTELPTLCDLNRWFKWPFYNLGVVCGWNGLVTIDFDEMAPFIYWWDEVQPKTRMSLTSRGAHVHFFCSTPPTIHKFMFGQIQGAGHIVVEPPSVHISGSHYQVLSDQPILRIGDIREVLPVEYLLPEKPVQDTQYKDVTPSIQPQPASTNTAVFDPWEMAQNADNPKYQRILKQDIASKIKARIPITLLVKGPYIPDNNGHLNVQCPFPQNHTHRDAHPSAFISSDGQFVCCTKCNPRGWDIISLYGLMKNVSNRDAILELAKLL